MPRRLAHQAAGDHTKCSVPAKLLQVNRLPFLVVFLKLLATRGGTLRQGRNLRMIVFLLDATSEFIDHATVLLMWLGGCVVLVLMVWMLILFLLSRHRYPP